MHLIAGSLRANSSPNVNFREGFVMRKCCLWCAGCILICFADDIHDSNHPLKWQVLKASEGVVGLHPPEQEVTQYCADVSDLAQLEASVSLVRQNLQAILHG